MTEHISRVMWRKYEPIHSSLYFYPLAAQKYREIGLKGGWMSYFASRSATLGTPDKYIVQAVFYHFSPDLVSRAIPDAWTFAKREEILATRLQLAHHLISSANAIPNTRASKQQLADLLEIAKSLPPEGRVLYASLVDMNWTSSPEITLFGIASLLREHRGDTHNAVLLSNSISGVQSHLLQIASGRVSHDSLFPNRGWNEGEWETGLKDLIERGILASESTSIKPTFTEAGKELKSKIEADTDTNSDPWTQLAPSTRQQFAQLLENISTSVKTFVAFPKENPIGV